MKGASVLGHDGGRVWVLVVEVRSDVEALGDDALRLRVVDRGERVRRERTRLCGSYAE